MKNLDTGSEMKSAKPFPRLSRQFSRVFGLVQGMVVFAPLLTAAGIFGFQVYLWARRGTWDRISFGNVMSYLGLPPASSFSPREWVGLAEAVRAAYHLPASLVFFLISLVAAFVLNLLHRK